MWETHTLDIDADQDERFIPTHVGNTWHRKEQTITLSVHPHACGKHIIIIIIFIIIDGSSPRMWETPLPVSCEKLLLRFIPTHVGNTAAFPRFAAQAPVHPHACGKHARTSAAKAFINGSSPRMWETHKIQT